MREGQDQFLKIYVVISPGKAESRFVPDLCVFAEPIQDRTVFMRVLLQNKKSRLFAQEAGTWTISIEEAFAFINSDKAIDFAFENKLSDVHLVFWFKEQNYCLTLPFQKEDEDAPSGSVPSPGSDDRQQL